MEENSASSTFVVTDPEMARVLTDPDHLRFIAPFLEHELTVSEVARETKSTLSTTYRRVERYCSLGILEVAREQPRKGKAVKLYRAVAPAFFVPHGLTDGEEVNSARWQAHWEEDFQRGFRHAFGQHLGTWGERVYRKDGIFNVTLASSPDEEVDLLAKDMPALFSRFHDSLYLDFAAAKMFQADLEALFKKYASQRGQQRYMMRVMFVPVPEDAEVIP